MANKPTILSPRERFTDAQGNVSRSWWRTLNSLFENNGTTATPLVTKPSAVLSAVDISSGGTISAPDLPAQTLIGNPAPSTAQPANVATSTSFVFNNGTIELASIAPGTLLGNGAAAAAAPGPITVGANLTLTGTVLSASAGSTAPADDQTLAYSLRDPRAEIAILARRGGENRTLLHAMRGADGGAVAGGAHRADDAMILALLAAPRPPCAPPVVTDLVFAMTGTLSGGAQINRCLTLAGTLLANGGAAQGCVPASPAAIQHLAINTIHAGAVTARGTIAISTAGAITWPAFAAVVMAPGDTVQIVNQPTADATFANACLCLQFQVS